LTRASEDAIIASPTHFKAEITYENQRGPLNIKVVDPLNVKSSNYTFRFINHRVKAPKPIPSQNSIIPPPPTTVTPTPSTAINYTGTIASININKTSWELKDLADGGKTYYPNEVTGQEPGDTLYQSIAVGNEYYFPELGFSISVNQVADPGERVNKFTEFTTSTDYTGPMPNSFLGATMTYENGTSQWMRPVVDTDGDNPFNWILSGGNTTENMEDAYYKKSNDNKVQAFYDPQKQYGKILGGTWAPYPLCASYYSLTPSGQPGVPARIFCGPAFTGEAWKQDEYLRRTYKNQSPFSRPDEGNTDLRKMSSALIVFTRDKAKWTRCPVLEMQEKAQLSEGNALFFAPRKHQSVDKEGKAAAIGSGTSGVITDANFISETGMGWFPGYAINIETGERLNMAFGPKKVERSLRQRMDSDQRSHVSKVRVMAVICLH
jgi:hypothetical protein